MAIFSAVFFSCPKSGQIDSYADCYLKINYKYNKPHTEDVEDDSISVVRYKGDKITTNLTALSGGKWKENSEFGYGYYDRLSNTYFDFFSTPNGDYEFLTNDGNIWSTADPLPGGEFVLTPNYTPRSENCVVHLYYKNNSNGYDLADIRVPYGTKLIDYEDGTPEGWTGGKWRPNPQNGRYQYTYAGSTYYVSSMDIGNGKRRYLFTTTENGAVQYDGTEPITESSINLYPIYIDDTRINVTINYKYIDKDMKLQEGSVVCNMLNYTSLEDHFGYSTPKDWGVKNFTTSFGGQGPEYEFIVNGKNASVNSYVVKYNLRKKGTSYVFMDSDGKEVLTNTPLNKETTLTAQYDQSNVRVTKKLSFKYYVNENKNGKNTTVAKEFVELFYDNSGLGNYYTLDLDSLLTLHDDETAEDRLFYGYVDYGYYDNPAYYYNRESNGSYKLLCKSAEGTTTTVTNRLNLDSYGVEFELKPLYTPAGHWPIKMSICEDVDLRFVFLPWCGSDSKSTGEAGWPYSQNKKKDSNGNWVYYGYVDESQYTDTYDIFWFNASIELFFGQLAIDQMDAARVIEAGKSLGYKFSQKATSAQYGLKYASQRYIPWNYVTYYDAIAFCNLLTELYNMNNSTNYTCSYMIKRDNKEYPFKDALNLDFGTGVGSGAIIKKGWDEKWWGSNTLFRLPDLCEWEYASRVITDERQLPTTKTYLISPRNNVMPHIWFYYQTAERDTSKYYGSGAGLAYYNSTTKTYNPSQLRTGAQAIGHTSASGELLKQKIDSSDRVDNNMKNGAGIFNMSGSIRQYVIARFSDGRDVMKGGSYKNASGATENRLGYVFGINRLDNSDNELSTAGLRVVFNPSQVTQNNP